MRARLEQYFLQTWYGNRAPTVFLLLLERLYRALFALNKKYKLGRRARDLEGKPILIVGNLSAGGTGKTPMVLKLCELARTCGLNPGVVSRGYGRRTRGALRVTSGLNPKDTGDEPLLIATRGQVPVQVDSDRENAARELFRDKVDLVIADDGLQRHSLPRRLEICLVDRQRGFGNGHLLPAGPLREPVTRLETVDFVVEHLPPGAKTMQEQAYSMRLEPGSLLSLHGEGSRELAEIRNSDFEIHAVAGISNPDRFFKTLEQAGIKCIHHDFPDHHSYRRSDFDQIPAGSMIVMTEKDAVKCRSLPLNDAWYIPVTAVLSESLENDLIKAFQSIKAQQSASPA